LRWSCSRGRRPRWAGPTSCRGSRRGRRAPPGRGRSRRGRPPPARASAGRGRRPGSAAAYRRTRALRRGSRGRRRRPSARARWGPASYAVVEGLARQAAAWPEPREPLRAEELQEARPVARAEDPPVEPRPEALESPRLGVVLRERRVVSTIAALERGGERAPR